MLLKFLKCKNPNINHIKMAFGIMLTEWSNYKCDCGYEFEGFVDIHDDVISDHLPAFENVDSEDETKEYPTIK